MLLKRHWIYEISRYNEFNTVDSLTQEIVLNFLPEYHNDMYMLDKLYWKCSWINLTLLKVQNKQKINIREWGHNFLQNIFEFNARTRLTKWRCVCFVTSVGDSLCVFVLQVVLHRGPSPSRPAWHSTPPPWSPSRPTPQSPTKRTRRTMKFRKNNYSPPPHTHTSNHNLQSCARPPFSTFPIDIWKHHWQPVLNLPPPPSPTYNILLCLLSKCFNHKMTWLHPCGVFPVETYM